MRVSPIYQITGRSRKFVSMMEAIQTAMEDSRDEAFGGRGYKTYIFASMGPRIVGYAENGQFFPRGPAETPRALWHSDEPWFSQEGWSIALIGEKPAAAMRKNLLGKITYQVVVERWAETVKTLTFTRRNAFRAYAEARAAAKKEFDALAERFAPVREGSYR